MSDVLLVIISAFGLVAFVIVGAFFFSECRFFKVVQEWQTLIGAVLGFGGVSVAILFQNNINMINKRKEDMSYESSLLHSVGQELQYINGVIKNHIDLSLRCNKNDNLDDVSRCVHIFNVLYNQKVRNISVSSVLSDMNGKISPETYSLIFRAVEARKMLDIEFDVPVSERCDQYRAGRAVESYADSLSMSLPYMEKLRLEIVEKATALR